MPDTPEVVRNDVLLVTVDGRSADLGTHKKPPIPVTVIFTGVNAFRAEWRRAKR